MGLQQYPIPPFLDANRPARPYLEGYPQYALAILHQRNGLSRGAIHALSLERTQGDTFYDQLAAIETKLTLNTIPLDKGKIWSWALAQWRANPKNVYYNRLPGFQQAQARYQTDKTLWVSDFWRFYNLGLSGTVTDEQAVEHTTACLRLANSLINHPQYGNTEWATTFRQLISNLYMPHLVNSVETARVYTWLLHNATRRGQKPRKFSEICSEWGWNTLSSNRLAAIVTHLGGVVDSNLDPSFS